jgi:para-nitrobenzyl esterase
MMAAYPLEDYEAPVNAIVAAFGHGLFNCPIRRHARAMAAQRATYMYFFNHPARWAYADTQGTTHGVELMFVFGTGLNLLGSLTDADRPLSTEMMGYWTRFAANGDPNGGAVAWPSFAPDEDHLNLTIPPAPGTGLLAAQCDYWDSVQ